MQRSVLMLLTLLVLGCQERHAELSVRATEEKLIPQEMELFQTQVLQNDVNDLARPVDVVGDQLPLPVAKHFVVAAPAVHSVLEVVLWPRAPPHAPRR